MSPLLSCRLRRDRRHRRLEIVEAVADELVGLRRDLRRTCWAICLGCVLFEYTVLEQVRDMLKWDVEVEPEAPCWAHQSRSEQSILEQCSRLLTNDSAEHYNITDDI